ncbi:hypothetical protein [uncultured Pedobacter sp.]|uniref:hypothetical protein n=1 Tax=uncultured Pedobacter sp. TaxID=246139 RepID=UPI0025E6C085|nr:hypothetical protein [uncultured Pedobacter sp.]
MKKINALPKVLRLCLLLATVILITIHACKRDGLNNTSDDIARAKDFFEKNVSLSDINPFSSLKANWSDVYVHQEGNQVIYEIGLVNSKNIFEANENIESDQFDKYKAKNDIRLVIFKNKSDDAITGGCYMSITNEGQTSNPVRYKSVENFSGILSFYSLAGSYANGWTYNSGRLINRLSLSTKKQYMAEFGTRRLLEGKISISGFKGGKIMLKQAVECYTTPVFIHGETCVGVDGYLRCTPYSRVIYAEVCDGGGGDGGYDPYPGNPSHGGDGNNNPNPLNDPPVNKDIIDSLQGYPCAQGILTDMPNLKNKIADSLKSVFVGSGSCTYYMKFIAQDTLKGKGLDGTTKTRTVPTNGVNFNDGYTFQARIELNPDVLYYATKEYILVTMYHEALHAYIAAELDRLGAVDFKIKYPDVNPAYIDGPQGRIDLTKAVFVADHSTMAQAFLTDLTKAILSFNPAFTETRAKALAKGGIVNLSQSEKDINDAERDTRKNIYHGKKC